MSDELENETPTNNEGVEEPYSESEDSGEQEEVTKVKRAYESQKIRAEKAEKKLKELEAKSAKPEKSEAPKIEEQSSEPDYAKLAYLEGKGISHPDDQKIVQDEAKRLKLPLTDVLGMEHIKSKLRNAKDQRDAEGGMPDSGTGKSGSSTKTSVEYWLNKKDKDGNYVTPDDLELANKVIDARVKQEAKGKMFSEDLHN